MKIYWGLLLATLVVTNVEARPKFLEPKDIEIIPFENLNLHGNAPASPAQHEEKERPAAFTPTTSNGSATKETALIWGRRFEETVPRVLGRSLRDNEITELKKAVADAKKKPTFENWAKLLRNHNERMVKRLEILRTLATKSDKPEETAKDHEQIDKAIFKFTNNSNQVDEWVKKFKEAKNEKERELPNQMFAAEFEYAMQTWEMVDRVWRGNLKTLDEYISNQHSEKSSQ